MKNADEFYIPIIKSDVLIDGISAAPAQKGGQALILQKAFVHSLQSDFATIVNNLVNFFYSSLSRRTINEGLVIIKKDNTAKIYSEFPLSLQMHAKKDMSKGTLVTAEDVFEITEMQFKDAIYQIDIDSGDKIIYLFRIEWKFGLYFDLTGTLNPAKFGEELAYHYKRLFYYDLYSFIENENYYTNLIDDGWFPFVRILGKDFDVIMQYYKDGRKHDFQMDDLIAKFDKNKIESFTQYWWRKDLFKDKKAIIESGISSFSNNDQAGFISCLHILYPQIEGIMGLDYFNAHGSKPNFKELQNYIKQKAESSFKAVSSLGFPNEFYEYLNHSVFENFDLATGRVDLSRHTTSHGYANANDFNKSKALQAILILDQIYFYL